MERAGIAKAGSDVVRRTAPLKVMIGLLYRELDAAKGGDAVTVNRELFEAAITTLECVVEDVEVRATPKAEVRVGVDANARATAVRA